MNKKKINIVLEEVLEKIKPPEEDLNKIKSSLKEFLEKLNKKMNNLKLDAVISIGGSFAKKTMINKGKYDIDIFIRFNKKYEKVSELTEKLLLEFKKIRIHGSRDYFIVEVNKKTVFEIIPVIKIKNPKEARNITDLSYFHISYINKKLKSKKVVNEIMITKAFCYANQCYGAESYIKGFSGYGLELLIYYYGSFLKFIKAVTKMKNEDEKIIIDIEKYFKNKQELLMNLNNSKLQSPIIFIDPTYKQRNVLAALSYETFGKFRKVCNEFLKNPKISFFEEKKVNLEKIKKQAEKGGLEFVLIKLKTDKQEGDIAGSKLLKFYKFLKNEISNYFEIKKMGFKYKGEKSGRYFFVVKQKKEILLRGPKVNDEENLKKFRKKHRNNFIKSGRVYAKEKVNFNVKSFIKNWTRKNKTRTREMSIKKLEVA